MEVEAVYIIYTCFLLNTAIFANFVNIKLAMGEQSQEGWATCHSYPPFNLVILNC